MSVSDAKIKLNVKELSGHQFYVSVNLTDMVLNLKSEIEQIRQFPAAKQRLIFSAQELIDTRFLSTYALNDGSTIHLVVRKDKHLQPQHSYGSININNHNNSGTEVLHALHGSRTTAGAAQTAHSTNVNISEQNSSETSVINNNHNHNHNNNNNTENNDYINAIFTGDGIRIMDAMAVARASKFIRLFSIIDAVLMLVFGLWSYYLLLGIPLALCGYYGAKKLRMVPLIVYILFILLSVGFRILLAYYYFSWLMVVLLVISVALELYILKQTVFVLRHIPHLNAHDYHLIQDMQTGLI